MHCHEVVGGQATSVLDLNSELVDVKGNPTAMEFHRATNEDESDTLCAEIQLTMAQEVLIVELAAGMSSYPEGTKEKFLGRDTDKALEFGVGLTCWISLY
jgi:hypothetical protein